MVESMIDYALGPHGRILSEVYQEHQFLINTLVVTAGMIKLFFFKKKPVK